MYCKLTDQDNMTHGNTLWGPGVTHKAAGKGEDLCSADVIHVYAHPLLAVMMNPAHANFQDPKLWRVEVKGIASDDGTKIGVKECTTIEEIPLPVVTTEQRVRFAILCALSVYHEEGFVQWAENWLSGKDRSESAAWSAWSTAGSAAWSAAWSAVGRARSAAESAAESARSAARSAESAVGSIDLIKLAKEAVEEV